MARKWSNGAVMSKETVLDELIRGEKTQAFGRWPLPNFDQPTETPASLVEDEVLAAHLAEDVEESIPTAPLEPINEVSEEELSFPTLAELERIRHEAYQEAYNEGFATGEKEGFHSGQLKGQQKAQQEAEQALAQKLAHLDQLMQQLFEPIAAQDQAIEKALLRLLVDLAKEVIRRELILDSSQITLMVREALKLLPVGSDQVRIHINPQDFAQIKALRERHEEQWRILEDEQLLPGGCRIETEYSRLDASIETRLSQAIEQLWEQWKQQSLHPPTPDIQLDLDQPHAP